MPSGEGRLGCRGSCTLITTLLGGDQSRNELDENFGSLNFDFDSGVEGCGWGGAGLGNFLQDPQKRDAEALANFENRFFESSNFQNLKFQTSNFGFSNLNTEMFLNTFKTVRVSHSDFWMGAPRFSASA